MKVPFIAPAACALALALGPASGWAADLTRLEGILAGLPDGGWARVNTTNFSSAFPTGSVAVNLTSIGVQGYRDPSLIIGAWSSFAWNSDLGSVMLFGGGHANYAGNEVYLWSGTTGEWSRASLPSALNSNWYVPDNSAPQSAHTYDNQVYLPVNQMFLTLGGAAIPLGNNFNAQVNGTVIRTGPWMFDPSKADPNKVGGTSGSGFDPVTPGGNMWLNRGASNAFTGTLPQSFIDGATAYRTEGGKDVVYVVADSWQSGWPMLYRYTIGDVRNGGVDTWEYIGRNSYGGIAQQGVAAIDSQHNLFVRTAGSANWSHDLIVWDLTGATETNKAVNKVISLVDSQGAAFQMTNQYGMDYDPVLGRFFLWDANPAGDVYSFAAQYDTNGALLTTWTVSKLLATTTARPNQFLTNGVLGKWQYVPELEAFIGMEGYANGDAGIWLYKPLNVSAVPELPTVWMWLLGLVAVVRISQRSLRANRSAMAPQVSLH